MTIATLERTVPDLTEAQAHSAEIIGRWHIWMRAQSWSAQTLENRTGLVLRVAREAGCPPEQLTTDQVLTFLAGAPSANTRKTYHVSLMAWFRWLQYAQVRPDDPMFGLPKPPVRRRPVRTISTDQLRRVLDSRLHQRTRTMILLGAYQGLRAAEIAKFRGSDIDLATNSLTVIGKGDVYAVLPLHPLVAAEAGKYGKGWWFPQWTSNRHSETDGPILGNSVSRVVSDAMTRADVPGSAHSLRHWFASELLRRGADLRVLQELMRHSTLNATERYLHVDDSQRRSALLLLTDTRTAA
jgi:integrase/recombinase XerD